MLYLLIVILFSQVELDNGIGFDDSLPEINFSKHKGSEIIANSFRNKSHIMRYQISSHIVNHAKFTCYREHRKVIQVPFHSFREQMSNFAQKLVVLTQQGSRMP